MPDIPRCRALSLIKPRQHSRAMTGAPLSSMQRYCKYSVKLYQKRRFNKKGEGLQREGTVICLNGEQFQNQAYRMVLRELSAQDIANIPVFKGC